MEHLDLILDMVLFWQHQQKEQPKNQNKNFNIKNIHVWYLYTWKLPSLPPVWELFCIYILKNKDFQADSCLMKGMHLILYYMWLSWYLHPTIAPLKDKECENLFLMTQWVSVHMPITVHCQIKLFPKTEKCFRCHRRSSGNRTSRIQ